MNYTKPAVTLLGSATRVIESGAKTLTHVTDSIGQTQLREKDAAYDLDE
jgi:hypothetical protein